MAARVEPYYVEVVTKDVDQVVKGYEELHSVVFSDPDPSLGGARTAYLNGGNGGRLGVRPPLRDDETPIIRPYWLVPSIEEAVSKAEAAGATIAVPPMEIPGNGMCAIYIQGGVEHGLWEVNK